MAQVTLIPITPQPIQKQTIKVGNTVIGVIEPITNSVHFNYHATLYSQYGRNCFNGFGQTIDDAIRDAIVSNKKIRHTELNELDELENAIWGDHELDQ